DVVEFVRHALGKMLREGKLPRPEHIDGEVVGVLEGGHEGRRLPQAPQHQRWIERHSRERVGREPLKPAVPGAGRYNTDPSHKLATGWSKVALVHRGFIDSHGDLVPRRFVISAFAPEPADAKPKNYCARACAREHPRPRQAIDSQSPARSPFLASLLSVFL